MRPVGPGPTQTLKQTPQPQGQQPQARPNPPEPTVRRCDTIKPMDRPTSFVPTDGESAPPSALLWAGWFTLCAVIALILSELIVDHQAARFAVFAGLTLASIWLSIAVRQLPHRVRSWWVRARGGDQQGNPSDD